jgi:phospholipid-binding lipoprotein MlaA
MQKKLLAMGLLIVFLFLNSGCAKKETDSGQAEDPYFNRATSDNYEEETFDDPLEFINRPMFWLNDGLYNYVFFPVTDAYEKIVPDPIKTGITNIFYNVTMPLRFVGDLLQGKGEEAIVDFWAPVFNAFGLWVVDIYYIDDNFDAEDISQVLASWGIPSGPFIVWPIFGPSNPRNTVGSVLGLPLDPVMYLGFPDSTIAGGIKVTNEYGTKNSYREIVEGAVDPYTSIKNAYQDNFKKKLDK